MWTLAFPTSAWVLWYNLVIKPRRREKRVKFVFALAFEVTVQLTWPPGVRLLRDARQRFSRTDDDGYREREKSLSILRDPARRSLRTEIARSGEHSSYELDGSVE